MVLFWDCKDNTSIIWECEKYRNVKISNFCTYPGSFLGTGYGIYQGICYFFVLVKAVILFWYERQLFMASSLRRISFIGSNAIGRCVVSSGQ